jgi:hypothetical protein
MNTPDSISEKRRSRPVWRWVLAGAGLCFAAAVLVVYQLITLSFDAAALRDKLASSLNEPVRTRVQLSVGPILCSTVRTGLSFVDKLPPEAKLAMSAVRKASVGVYALSRHATATEKARMFSSADAVMQKRGWTRVVGVNDADAMVLVYIPNGDISGSTERACVAVCNEEYLVVVSGTIRLDPLMEIASRKHLLALR